MRKLSLWLERFYDKRGRILYGLQLLTNCGSVNHCIGDFNEKVCLTRLRAEILRGDHRVTPKEADTVLRALNERLKVPYNESDAGYSGLVKPCGVETQILRLVVRYEYNC